MKHNIKAGDKVICIKEGEVGQPFFRKNEYYEVIDVNKYELRIKESYNCFLICHTYSISYYKKIKPKGFSFHEYFMTIPEYRRQKLLKIDNIK